MELKAFKGMPHEFGGIDYTEGSEVEGGEFAVQIGKKGNEYIFDKNSSEGERLSKEYKRLDKNGRLTEDDPLALETFDQIAREEALKHAQRSVNEKGIDPFRNMYEQGGQAANGGVEYATGGPIMNPAEVPNVNPGAQYNTSMSYAPMTMEDYNRQTQGESRMRDSFGTQAMREEPTQRAFKEIDAGREAGMLIGDMFLTPITSAVTGKSFSEMAMGDMGYTSSDATKRAVGDDTMTGTAFGYGFAESEGVISNMGTQFFNMMGENGGAMPKDKYAQGGAKDMYSMGGGSLGSMIGGGSTGTPWMKIFEGVHNFRQGLKGATGPAIDGMIANNLGEEYVRQPIAGQPTTSNSNFGNLFGGMDFSKDKVGQADTVSTETATGGKEDLPILDQIRSFGLNPSAMDVNSSLYGSQNYFNPYTDFSSDPMLADPGRYSDIQIQYKKGGAKPIYGYYANGGGKKRDREINKHLQPSRTNPEEFYYGKTLPEVTVTDKLDRTNPTALQNWSKKNDPIAYAARKDTDDFAETLRTPLEVAPGTGDIMDAIMLLEAVDKGDYGTLGTAALATILPGATVGGLKRVSKYLPEIDLGRWGKFNKAIPDNKILREEYADIEQMTKANNTWMKNPDGSAFRGTPEQFVQQQSENFKRAFPPEHFERMYHGSKKGNLEELNVGNNSYGQQAYGEGLYMTDSFEEGKFYAGLLDDPKYRTGNERVYDLAVNTEGAQKFDLSSWEDKAYLNKWNRSYLPTIEYYFGKPKSEIPAETLKRYENIQGFADNVPENMKDLFNNIVLDMPKGVTNEREATKWILGKKGVKSLEGNSGMFDMTNPNIYYKNGGVKETDPPVGVSVTPSGNVLPSDQISLDNRGVGSSDFGIIPANLEQYFYTLLGGNKQFTEKDMTPEEYEALVKLYNLRKEPNTIGYSDHNKVGSTDIAKASMLTKLTNEPDIIRNLIGAAAVKDGYITTDYNFGNTPLLEILKDPKKRNLENFMAWAHNNSPFVDSEAMAKKDAIKIKMPKN